MWSSYRIELDGAVIYERVILLPFEKSLVLDIEPVEKDGFYFVPSFDNTYSIYTCQKDSIIKAILEPINENTDNK